MPEEKPRCEWCLKDQLYRDYHDKEWGIPQYDNKKLFELLILEGAQAGLSWHTVLKKRGSYRQAFEQWDIEKIARYDDAKKAELLNNPGIIRNRLKVAATISNAQAYLKMQENGEGFSEFIWSFTAGKPIVNHFNSLNELPAKTTLSDKMSKALKQKGFRFVGSTICYAFMQAAGLVDDHMLYCWKR
ncbi:MAG: DNA-3-methyladenine glycosylase I, partial [Chitinophagales bacterium]